MQLHTESIMARVPHKFSQYTHSEQDILDVKVK
jgi:hypothetical protein